MVSVILMYNCVYKRLVEAVGVLIEVAAPTVKVNDFLLAKVKKHSKIFIFWRAFLINYLIEMIPLHSKVNKFLTQLIRKKLFSLRRGVDFTFGLHSQERRGKLRNRPRPIILICRGGIEQNS